MNIFFFTINTKKLIDQKIRGIWSPELNQEGEWVNIRFTTEKATYEEWYYIVDGKNQTWQQAKMLKAKGMPLKKINITTSNSL